MHVFGEYMRFNEIENRNQLADFLKIERSSLSYVLYILRPEMKYRCFSIPKKDGSMRCIESPVESLKFIQHRLASEIYRYYDEECRLHGINRKVANAFEKGKGIYTNASIHRNKKYVFCFDIEDFFPSFNFGRVLNYFQKNALFGMNYDVSVCIAQLVCNNGVLPQGAPTSPLISNLIFQIVDSHVLKVAKKYSLAYSRYADDLTFSTNRREFIDEKDEFAKELEVQIRKDGFKLNTKKTRFSRSDSKQRVTGLVVNKRVSVDGKYYKNLRATLHRLYCTGKILVEGAEVDPNLQVLEGKLEFINEIEKRNNTQPQYNAIGEKVKHDYKHLNKRENEKKRFLFYKYFIANKKPVIITEGKTDALYIKAALKKLYKSYPSLIIKNGNNFIFNVSFFKRKEIFKYFWNVSTDGADSMSNMYNNCFSDKGIAQYFAKFGCLPQFTVIMLFDNETVDKNKPLAKFIGIESVKSRLDKKEFDKKLYQKLDCSFKRLYLSTIPLVKDKREAEIEDLFDDVTLAIKIDGRSFGRNKSGNNSYYNKNVFSKYVYEHYEQINFDGFKPLLSVLDFICSLPN